MITTIPVGSWFWEAKAPEAADDLVHRCVRDLLGAWDVMREVGVASGDARAGVLLQGRLDDAALFTRKDLILSAAGAGRGSELLRRLPSVRQLEAEGPLTVDLSVPGVCLREGGPASVEKLFEISIDVWASGAWTMGLYTFSDAWMSHDLRGHKQSHVRKLNAPRLAAALTGITGLLGVDITPGDASSYGIPTPNGFEDLPDEDPDLLDSWYMFEVPRRTDELHGEIPAEAPEFETVTDLPVTFAAVAVEGRVVGYVWAADADDAAGYEPYTPAGDVSLAVGRVWLERLSRSKARDLSPSKALRELASYAASAEGGAVVPGPLRVADSLEALQDLSGRE